MNGGGDCRTAPASPEVLKIIIFPVEKGSIVSAVTSLSTHIKPALFPVPAGTIFSVTDSNFNVVFAIRLCIKINAATYFPKSLD